MSFEILPYREASKDVSQKGWIMFFDSGLERNLGDGQTAIALSSSPPHWPTPRLGYPQDLSLWSDRQRQFLQSKGVQINGI